jgi:DNA-binding winged helix-turn-helix (wHTH) protein
MLTHSALLREVWGAAYAEERRTLRTHIANLRRKLEAPGGTPVIRTDHGVGYRLTDWEPELPVRALAAQPRRLALAPSLDRAAASASQTAPAGVRRAWGGALQ